jgi:hypothetical protein
LNRLARFSAEWIDHRTAWKAALFLGAIIWLINLPHGAVAALPAALKQAAYTFVASGFIARLCERLAVRIESAWTALPLSSLVPSVIAIGLTYLVHSLRGTPEPLYSTIPTILLAPPSLLVWGWRKRRAARP